MQAVDIDKSGSIDYHEFLIAATNRKKYLEKENLHKIFKDFDKDGNGSISISEIRTVLGVDCSNDKDKAFEKMLKMFDIDGDGEISKNEFVEMFKKILT